MYWLGVVRILRHLKIDIPQPTRCYTPTGVLYSLKVKFNYCCPDKCLNIFSFDKCETFVFQVPFHKWFGLEVKNLDVEKPGVVMVK